jgi:hypothetical protein
LLLVLATGCHRQKPPSLMPSKGEPPPLRLDFRPPVGRVLTETGTTTRTVTHAGAQVAEEAEVRMETRYTPASGGWLMTQAVTRTSLTRAGTPVNTLADAVLRRFALQVKLAADGAFVDAMEPEAAQQALHEVAPAGADVGALEAFFAPDAVEARARHEWEVKYAGLFRRNLVEGQRTWVVDRFPAGEGEVTYVLERIVTGTEASVYGDALTLGLRCLDKVSEGAPKELREAWEAAGSPALTPGVTCEGEQVVARALFVPVRRSLTVHAKLGEDVWTLSTRTKAEKLEEEAR